MIAGAKKVVQEVMSGDAAGGAAAAKIAKKQSKIKSNGTDIAAGMKSLEVIAENKINGSLTNAL